MRTKRVTVVPYDPTWPHEFEKIKQKLLPAIGEYVIAVEHVGSTSVEGLSAKPVIDIDVVMFNDDAFRLILEKLSEIGYRHEGNLGIKDREASKYEGKAHLMKHHLYVCPRASEELNRHLVFREYLRTHWEAVEEYSRIKEEAAKIYPTDIDGYMAYKSPCIEKLYEKCGLKG